MNYLEIHKKAFVLDSHCDTPLELSRGAKIDKKRKEGHFDLTRMKEGGVDAVFFAIYTSGALSPDQATTRALELIAFTYDALEENYNKVSLARSAQEALFNKESGLKSVFLGMENGAPIQNNLSLLRLFNDLGITYMTLCHSKDNQICDSCAPKTETWGGLSPFGKEVIKEMNNLDMLIDVSHISDNSFYDVLKYSSKPVVATHSCCRALADHPRNLTDQMIKDLASNGGVIQINFYPPFLDSDYATKFWPLCDIFDEQLDLYRKFPRKHKESFIEARDNLFSIPRPSYKRVVDHIDHVVNLVGIEHVGLGSDFDGIEIGPEGLESIDKFPVITKELVERGYKKEDIELILGGNFLKLL